MSGMSIGQFFEAVGQRCPETIDSKSAPHSIKIDSRKVEKGDVFIALMGTKTDGHNHVEQAIDKGASLVVVERKEFSHFNNILYVDSTLDALAHFAAMHRTHCRGKIIGVTGSVGKTTAKDFLKQLMDDGSCSVYASPKSFNSEIGLPLAVLSAPFDCDYIILEYGINEPGEMEKLTSIVSPDLAFLTSIGLSHLDGMHSLETIAIEKNKLLQAVPVTGHFWLPEKCLSLIPTPSHSWLGAKHNFNVEEFVLEHSLESCALKMTDYERETAFLCLEIALYLGISKKHSLKKIEKLQKPPGRMEYVETKSRLVFINDAYNANPVSTRAGLAAFSKMPCAGRKIAIVGSMLELGDEHIALHRQIGHSLDGLDLDTLICVGELAAEVGDNAPSNIKVLKLSGVLDACNWLYSNALVDDLIYLKASRGEAFEDIIAYFQSNQNLERCFIG